MNNFTRLSQQVLRSVSSDTKDSFYNLDWQRQNCPISIDRSVQTDGSPLIGSFPSLIQSKTNLEPSEASSLADRFEERPVGAFDRDAANTGNKTIETDASFDPVETIFVEPDPNGTEFIDSSVENQTGVDIVNEGNDSDFDTQDKAISSAASSHHYDPLTDDYFSVRNLQIAEPSGTNNKFLEAQLSYFRGGGLDYSTNDFQDTTAIKWGHGLMGRSRLGYPKTLTWTFSGENSSEGNHPTMNSNFESYRMGLIAVTVVLVSVIVVWLVALAIFWRLGPERVGFLSGHFDGNGTVESIQDSTSNPIEDFDKESIQNHQCSKDGTNRAQNHTIADRVKDDTGSADDNEKVIMMECHSEASPRWLSFPRNPSIAIKKVASYFTNTSLASLASSSSSSSSNDNEDEGMRKQCGESNFDRTIVDDIGSTTSQLYRVGVLRNGKLNVSSDSDLASTTGAGRRKAPCNTGEDSISGSIPLRGLLMDLYADFMECDDNMSAGEDPTISFGSHSNFSKASDGSKSISHNTQSTGVSTATSCASSDYEILKDLEQLERVTSTRQSPQASEIHRSSPELRDLRNLEREISRLSNSSEPQILPRDQTMTPSMISSFLTTVLQQQNPSLEEGVEIWYDAQARTFFQPDKKTCDIINSNEKDAIGAVADKTRNGHHGMDGSDESPWTAKGRVQKKRIHRRLSNNKRTIDPGQSKRTNKNPEAPTSTNETVNETKRDEAIAPIKPGKSFNRLLVRLAFLFATASVMGSSLCMATIGGNKLQEAFGKSYEVLEAANSLAHEGVNMVDASFASMKTQVKEASETNGTQDLENAPLEALVMEAFSSINATCDGIGTFSNQVAGVWWKRMETLSELESLLMDGMQSIEESSSNLFESLQKTNWIVSTLRAINVLLFTICMVLLFGRQYYSRWVVPPYVVLITLTFVVSASFLFGSTAFADFCKGGPDDRVVQYIQSRKLSGERMEDPSELLTPDLIYDMASYYVQKCPLSAIPVDWTNAASENWDTAGVLFETAQPWIDFSRNDDLCPSNDEIRRAGNALLAVSCELSCVVQNLIDFSRCDHWYPLYQSGMHDAVCHSGVSGLMWVAITQSVAVVMSLFLLTFRAGYCLDASKAAGSDGIENNNNNNNNTVQQNTTMISDDDDDTLPQKAQSSPDSKSDYQNFYKDDWKTPKPRIEFDQETAKIMKAELNRMSRSEEEEGEEDTSVPWNSYTSRDRRCGMVDHTGTTHTQYSSTETGSKYSIRTNSVQSDECPNVEVFLNQESRSEQKLYLHTSNIEDEDGDDEEFDNDYYFQASYGSWSNAVTDPFVTGENLSKELDRLKDRLEGIQQRRATGSN